MKKGGTAIQFERDPTPETYYSVVTLNYDLVLERFAIHIASRASGDSRLVTFSREDKADSGLPIFLAKLHGSADDPANIIPPTWNKVLDGRTVGQWKLAHKLLENANQIRIIGYSLPETDSYIKYLLKSAVVKAKNLKRIDVLRRHDYEDLTVKRYKEFVRRGPHLNFPTSDPPITTTEQYLDRVRQAMKMRDGNAIVDFRNAIEEAHFSIFPKLD